jgi:hemoglobin-like flavoprotein
MTNHQIQLVRQSWQKAAEEPLRLAILFYDRLFEQAPELRYVFRTPMSVQTSQLMKMFGFYINHMNRPIFSVSMIQEFGLNEELSPAQLSFLTETLVLTIKNILEVDWNQEMEASWTAFNENCQQHNLSIHL